MPVVARRHLSPPPPLSPLFAKPVQQPEQVKDDDVATLEPPKKKARRTTKRIFKLNPNTKSKRTLWLCSALSLAAYDV